MVVLTGRKEFGTVKVPTGDRVRTGPVDGGGKTSRYT